MGRNSKKKNKQQQHDAYEIQTPNDVIGWTIDEVISWAKDIGLDQDDVGIFKREKVNGKGLIGLTYDRLVNAPFSLAGGPASQIDEAVRQLRPPDKSPPFDLLASTAVLKAENQALREQIKAFSCVDVWTGLQSRSSASSRTQRDRIQFCADIIDYYEMDPEASTCMLTGLDYTHGLKAAHIWPSAHAVHVSLESLHITDKQIHSPRNGLLLLSTIEGAFDRKEVCFLYDPFNEQLIFNVLNKRNLENAACAKGITFGSLHNTPLILPAGKFPFRRLLNAHARAAYRHAYLEGWIAKDILQKYEDYAKFSDDATEGPDAADTGTNETLTDDID